MDILVELDYLNPEGGVEVVSPEIKIEPKIPPKIIQEPLVEQQIEKKKVTAQPIIKPQSSVKALFNIEKEPSVQPIQKTATKDKSPNELFEDLF